MSFSTIKDQALAEIHKLEDGAVKEYLLLKAKSYSLTVVAIAAAAGLVIGLVL